MIVTVPQPHKAKEVRARRFDFCNRRLFMPQRRRLRIRGVSVPVVRGWEHSGLERKPVG